MSAIAGALAVVQVGEGHEDRVVGVGSLIDPQLVLLREPLQPELVGERVPPEQLRVRMLSTTNGAEVVRDLEISGVHRNDGTRSPVVAVSLVNRAPIEPVYLAIDDSRSDEENLQVLVDHARYGSGESTSSVQYWRSSTAIFCRLWNPPPPWCPKYS